MLPNVCDPVEYGLPKTNYDTNGVVNPETELDASEYEPVAVDVAAMSHVAPRAIVYVNLVVGGATILDYDSVWGDAPAVTPVAARSAQGVVTVTWAASGYNDLNPTPARQVQRAPNIRFAHASGCGVSAAHCTCTWIANVATVYVWDAAGAALDGDFVLVVY